MYVGTNVISYHHHKQCLKVVNVIVNSTNSIKKIIGIGM